VKIEKTQIKLHTSDSSSCSERDDKAKSVASLICHS